MPDALRQRSAGGGGVNFLGYAAGSGLSMSDVGSLLRRALDADGRSVSAFELSVGGDAGRRAAAPRDLHPATVALVQSGHVPTAAVRLPRLFSPRRFRAAVVHYELPQVPLTQRLAFPFVDEVWTTSEFVRDAFLEVTRRPVRVLPLPVLPPSGRAGAMRAHLGLGDEYLFGYQFDLASSGERKNPAAVVEAFSRAFPEPSPSVRLLLKSVHAAMSPHVWAQVQRAAAGRPDVLLVDDYWPVEVVDAFFADVDCYVSLHRAEGFGLTLAKAMAAGKPVVATGYSGNLTFMTDETSVLVPWRTVRVGADPVYPADGTWAEPDVEVAAQHMRRFAQDPDAGRRLGARAQRHVEESMSVQRTAAWLRAHVPA